MFICASRYVEILLLIITVSKNMEHLLNLYTILAQGARLSLSFNECNEYVVVTTFSYNLILRNVGGGNVVGMKLGPKSDTKLNLCI